MTPKSTTLPDPGAVERVYQDLRYRALCAQPGEELSALLTRAADTIRALKTALDDESNAVARWIIRFSEVRSASGIGVKPMLDEVPAALAALKSRAEAAEAKLAALQPSNPAGGER